MDIGHELRRYRAEPVISPVPGEPEAPREETPARTAEETPSTREVVEASA